ncbi:hypothetical protein VHEMI05172 [[Torrubiella] hemipterigena]|uniref:Uncharacterized protein n=1 Tax=[Torrubiella] hemipterigena TaxID=1531966 RepID=A0A0A1TGE3_9HYPO|nr:hypothetical protein VHEMI05172 [[Torrubiella] hemipterigena]
MIPPASTLQLKSTTPRYSKALPAVPGLFVSAAESAVSDLPPTPPPRSKDRKLPTEARRLALEQKKSLPNIKKAAIPPKKSLPDIRKLPDPPSLADKTPAEIKKSLVGPRKPVGSSTTSSTPKPAPISKSIPTTPAPTRKAVASPPTAIPTRKAVASSGIIPSAAELAVIAASNPSSPATPQKSLPPKPLPNPKASPDKLAPPSGIARKAVGKMNPISPYTISEPSPAISSILSPYARGFDSPVESLDASTDRTSFNSSRQPSPLRLTKEASPTKTLPSIPAKQPTPPPKSPVRAELPASNLAKTSPPRPEIWRRRPQNNSGSRELPDLNLGRGYGSPVAVPKAPSSPEKEISDMPSPTKPARSRPNPTGLPGRNVRPGAAKGAVSNSSTRRPDLDMYPSQRPPTPEYRKSEGKAPSIEVVKKPASPVSSSADSPTRSSPDFTSRDIPPKPPKHDFSLQAEQVRRRLAAKGTGVPAPAPAPAALPAPIPVQEPVRAPVRAPTPTKPPPPAKALPVPPKSSSPDNKMMSTRTSDASSTVMSVVTARTSPSETSSLQDFSASSRSESRAAEQRKPMEGLRPDLRDPRIVYSDAHGAMYKGRDGTLYPEMRSLGIPDSRAMYFPKTKLEPMPKSGVITAPVLKISHYNCFQQHKTMGRRSNRTYPLTCQTCCKSDTEDRWACSFCHLRLCESCLTTFNENDKDLNRLMGALAGRQI